MTFPERLADWQEFDAAVFHLAVTLGVIPEGEPSTRHEWLFWSDNPVGNALHDSLMSLVQAGVLEQNQDGHFRWAKSD